MFDLRHKGPQNETATDAACVYYLLIGLHHMTEICLGHLSAINPEARSVEGDLNLLHVLHPDLALLHLLQLQVERALVQDDCTACTSETFLHALGRIKGNYTTGEGVSWERDEVSCRSIPREDRFE